MGAIDVNGCGWTWGTVSFRSLSGLYKKSVQRMGRGINQSNQRSFIHHFAILLSVLFSLCSTFSFSLPKLNLSVRRTLLRVTPWLLLNPSLSTGLRSHSLKHDGSHSHPRCAVDYLPEWRTTRPIVDSNHCRLKHWPIHIATAPKQGYQATYGWSDKKKADLVSRPTSESGFSKLAEVKSSSRSPSVKARSKIHSEL